jgi:hypothetical protein
VIVRRRANASWLLAESGTRRRTRTPRRETRGPTTEKKGKLSPQWRPAVLGTSLIPLSCKRDPGNGEEQRLAVVTGLSRFLYIYICASITLCSLFLASCLCIQLSLLSSIYSASAVTAVRLAGPKRHCRCRRRLLACHPTYSPDVTTNACADFADDDTRSKPCMKVIIGVTTMRSKRADVSTTKRSSERGATFLRKRFSGFKSLQAAEVNCRAAET